MVMNIPQAILLKINKFFKLPVHPFNLSNEGGMSYAEWQFEKGARTIDYYLASATREEMFEGKSVLDIGCGAAGKSVYYASLGARRVVGLDVVERYRSEAIELARRKGYEDRFEFVCADAAKTEFKDGSFDTVIMNDAVEHVERPEAVLRECLRVLAPGGRLYLNFPPYYHPYGAHLSDAIAIPWVHVFFSESTLIGAYKELVSGLPDGDRRVGLRISERSGGDGGSNDSSNGSNSGGSNGSNSGSDGNDGEEYFSYINHMTIKRFRKILRELLESAPPPLPPAPPPPPPSAAVECAYYSEEPLRGFLRPLARLPGIKEFFVKMVVAVIKKTDMLPEG